jgi:23S rRNA (pseudouridine1915-N3)-methyltransferase
MKILLLQIDKTQEPYLLQGTEVYTKRLANYTRFDTYTINVPKNVRQRSVAEQKEAEARLVMEVLQPEDHLVLLDEKGREMSSEAFAAYIGKQQSLALKRLVFLVGGPFGFSEQLYSKAAFKLSLSQMTFSHQMVRLFFLEQLYRAFTILKGEKYHHS